MSAVLFDYDENLSVNPFYKVVHSHHEILLQAAGHENWVICVPRAGCLARDFDLNTDFILRHILVENTDLLGHYTNLLGSNVILDDRQLVLVVSRTQQQQLSRKRNCAVILFEELVYRTDPNLGLTKFRVWCLDRPIPAGDSGGMDDDSVTMDHAIPYYRIENFVDADKFLSSEFVKSKFILQRIQKICHEFMDVQRTITTVDILYQTTKTFLNRVWNVLMSSNCYVKKLVKEDPNYARMLRKSVEIYATHFVSKFLLDQIASLEATGCELLNMKIVNLQVNLKDKIGGDNGDLKRASVIHSVSTELLAMESRTTVYDKLSLLREVMKGISTGNVNSQSEAIKSSDEVLEVLVDAMIGTRSLNWHQNLILLKRFQFTESENDSSELSYLVTTLEAAQQCILQEKLINESPSLKTVPDDPLIVNEIPIFTNKMEFLKFLFDKIQSRDEAIVLEMINLLTSTDDLKQKLISQDLCHPLCDCESCQLKIIDETPTIGTQSPATGDSCVHLVARYGMVNAMRRILTAGSMDTYHRLKNANGETPMHVAAKCGQQNILLLVLHHDPEVNLNVGDNKGNSVLHLSAQMGHANCVKALLYFAEHKQLPTLQVNRTRIVDQSVHE